MGDGRLGQSDNASLAFLLRGWSWPAPQDWPFFLATGLAVSTGGLMISQDGYTLALSPATASPGPAVSVIFRILGPDGITLTPRGRGTNTRHVNNIAMEMRDVADSLLVTEVFTPAGHWSSYPSHRHDEDDFPRMTYLEETYYMRLNPAQGFGIQRVYTEDGSLDETMAVKNHDVTLVPKGHHPCGAPYGYEMYYLNVMAGPLRKWRFHNDPDHDWIAQRDAG